MAQTPSLKPAPVAPEPAVVPTPAWGDTLPQGFLQVPFLRWLAPLSGETRLVIGFAAFATLLFVPWLGATGFWDPWEPHYGEVAREMIARGDYIHPWWESAYFFSKPALDLWIMAAGMLLAHTNGPDRFIGVYTEWFVRLPFAIVSAVGAILLFVAASRLVSRRAAAIGTFAMLTSPLVVMLARQAVPDPVFVGLLTAAMSCLMIVLFSEDETSRDGWAIAAFVFIGLATLSKGILGFALPGATALVYCMMTGEWHRLRRLRLFTGTLVVVAIAAPWYLTMFAFPGRDDEGQTFFDRFIIHDHFQRLLTGVHTTTPGGTFTYFVEQLGFDVFPWVFALPGAFGSVLARRALKPRTPRDRALFFVLLWLLVGFGVFAFSATKFHHYAFPVLPPLLLFCGVFCEKVLDEGLRVHAGELLAGGLLYGLVAHDLALVPKHITDMFVYNYDRPYPFAEVDPRRVFTVLFYAAPAVALSPWLFDRLSQLFAWARALLNRSRRAELRVQLHDGKEEPQDRVIVVVALALLAAAFAVYLGWFHFRALSPHWTQRDLFWEYYQQSTPDEPIGAYLMNWRGETFYSRNRVRQLKDQAKLNEFMAGPGQRKWLLVEQARVPVLRQALGKGVRLRVVESRNNKFVLTVLESRDATPSEPGPVMQPPPGPFGAPP
ncbi:MAG: ArnT family glycosyltransferase [Myxococcales bacterium]